ncbi:23S rRNA pseudouridine2604 synthase [Paraburkholderia sp. WC7.3g]|uniref:pseudouridine synthase n=1 Tax=Paraburkholderia sp. WC7.3g TaxID=2991070 RepID=UPI003D21E68D
MRTKLTAKHPRPASSERTPVRPGSASARKPTRPARPKPFEAEAGATREGAASKGGGAKRPAGAKPAGSGARSPRAEGSFARERGAAPTGAPRRFEGAGERGERAPRHFEGSPERGERAPRREFGERAERAPRRFEGSAERGERAPRREFGERAERAPRRFEGSAERGEHTPRREFGERGERAPRRFEGSAERGERAPRREFGERGERAPRREFGERSDRAPRRFEGNAERGERAPRSFGERAPRRDDGERRPFSGPRAGAGRPPEGGARGDRPVRRERDSAERPRFGSDRGEPQERRGGDRGTRSDSAPRRFEGERGERSFAKPVSGGYGERTERPARATREDRGERGASGEWTPSRRESGERTERRDRPARSFDNTLPAASRRFGDDRPARAAKPRTSASKASQPLDTTVDAARPPRRDREDAPGMLRLSKLMSKLGICSRREADEWIEKGWVMVDGERVDTLGAKVFPDQRIDIDPAAEAAQSSQVTVIIHKPVGLVSGQAEDDYQPAITLVTPENRWEGDRSGIGFSLSHLRQLAPAGRLDIDSTGLLVLTQDGRIAKQLIGGHSEVDKEYLVRVAYGERTVDVESHFPAEKLALLCHGLSLDDVALKPAQVSWQNGEQLRFVLREGKKRQIRRMCELVGLDVLGLKRVRVGQVMLGALPPGQWRYLSADESF